MCGIAGFSGSFSREALEHASSALAHRGPDDAGIFLADGIGLAHRRLSIIDLSAEACQPMASDDGDRIIVFNGEIYNYRELRLELQRAGHQFRTQSDTEVVLELYRRDGEAMLARLDGIFAFALWDARRNALLVARDAFGVKPLYYAGTARGFVFASEIKALVQLAPELRRLNPAAIHRYLTYLWCPGAETPLQDVRKLGPGESMWVVAGRAEPAHAWYRLPAYRSTGAVVAVGEAIAGTRDRLRSAVHRQLVADVPVGAFLSGGIDSSAVVAMAKERHPGIQCFTIAAAGGNDADFADDLPYAKRVAQHLGVPLDVVAIDAAGMAADLEHMVWQLDEPLADPAPLNVVYISLLARRAGMKVLLSGAGGDDLFSGYRRHAALEVEPYWRWLPQPVLRALERTTSGLDQRRPALRRITKLFSGASLSGDRHLANYYRWIGDSDLSQLYQPEFRIAAEAESASQPLLDYLGSLPPGTDPLTRMLALEQRFFLPDHNLTYTDKMSMAAGIEVRVPFLDRELVDFAARIPPEWKQRGRVSKWVLKQAVEPLLPPDVVHRKKAGFGAPWRRWLRHELRPLLEELLSAESIRSRGMFEPASVAMLIDRHRTGKIDAAYTLLSLLCIEIWCRAFLDRAAPPSSAWNGQRLLTAAA